MKTYFIFVDESGQLRGKKDPFYIKSCFFICSEHWREIRNRYIELKEEFEIEIQQELKWQHIWGLKSYQNKRKKILKDTALYPYRNVDYHNLMMFIEKALIDLNKIPCVKYLLTISPRLRMNEKREKAIHKMHIQEIMQRVEMELSDKDNLGVVFHDEMDPKKDKIVRDAYSEFFLGGDILKYNHIKDGLSIDISSHSFGIQIADFAAGAFMGFMKDYEWSVSLFVNLIAPKLRRSPSGYIFGYGVRDVPHIPAFRGELIRRFNETGIS